MTTVRTIAKNTIFLLASQAISILILLFYTSFTLRYLLPEGFGLLSLAISVTNLFIFFTDPGLGTLMTREIARDRSLISKYLGNLAVIRVALSVLTFVLIAVFANLRGYPQQTIYVVYIMAVATVLYAFNGLFNSVFQAYEKMEYQSIGNVLNSVVILAGSLYAVQQHLGVVEFAMVTLIADLVLLIFSFLVCTLLFPLPKLEFDWVFSKAALTEALPFGISGVFMTIYYSVDSVILQSMHGDTVLGWYSASSRLIRYLAILPQIISVTIFPAMARFHLSSKDSLMLISEKYLKYMLVLGIPMGVGTTILADKIIYTFAGPDYTESIPAMQILIWSMVFVFAGASLTRLFESANKQRLVTRITGVGMVLNVALNLTLIPLFSYIGSSIAVVLTELSMLSLLVYSIYRLGYELPARKLLGIILKVIVASTLMGLVIWYLHDLNLFVIVAIAIVIYSVLIIALNVIDKEDLDLMRSIVKKGQD